MAEALGTVSSVAGLLSLGLTICKGLHDFYSSYQDAAKDVTDLLHSLGSLSHSLDLIHSAFELPRLHKDLAENLDRLADELRNGIDDLRIRLEKIKLETRKDGGTAGLKARLHKSLYPFKEKTIKKLKYKCDDLRENLSIAVQTLQINASSITTNMTETMQQDIVNTHAIVEEIKLEIADLTLTGQKRILRGYFDSQMSLINETESRHTETFNMKGCQDDLNNELLERVEFKDWQRTAGKTLWYRGIPGAGKTVFASFIINFLQKTSMHEDVGVAFTYCNYKRDHFAQKPANVLAVLLWHLIRGKCPSEITHRFEEIRAKHAQPSQDDYCKMLKIAIAKYSRVYIVIDALDEYPEKDGFRTELLLELNKMLPNASFLITSRPIAITEDHLSEFHPTQLDIQARDDDIVNYISGRLTDFKGIARRLIKDTPGLEAEVTKEIVTKACGMFLVARLHLDSLLWKSNPRKIKEALYSLANGQEGLDLLYDDALKRIDEQASDDAQLGNEVLLWVSLALRPLSIMELQHALAVRPGGRVFDTDGLEDPDHILSVCAGLVGIDKEDQVVRLIHYTTQEYFDRTCVQRFSQGQSHITRICLPYQSFHSSPCYDGDDRSDWVYETEDNDKSSHVNPCFPLLLRYHLAPVPLLSCAVTFWGYHAKKDSEFANDIRELVLKLFSKSNIIHVTSKILYKYMPWSLSGSGMHEIAGSQGVQIGLLLAITSEFEELCSFLLQNGATVEPLLLKSYEDKVSVDMLYEAAVRGNSRIGQMLLDRGAVMSMDRSHVGFTALERAAIDDHEDFVKLLLDSGAHLYPISMELPLIGPSGLPFRAEIVKCLLEAGANVNQTIDRSYASSPLIAACRSGDENLVQILLQAGASVNPSEHGFHDSEPLSDTIVRGHVSIVEQLIEAGAWVNPPRSSPLALACYCGHRSIVHLLVRAGAAVNPSIDNLYMDSPLAIACNRSHTEIVRILLNAGAHVDPPGSSPLLLACRMGNITVVEDLLAAGATVDSSAYNHNEDSPLVVACFHNHTDIAKLLVHAGAQINSPQSSPLLLACRWGNMQVLESLLEAGARVNLSNHSNETESPLAAACKSGHLDIVKRLLGAGAYISPVDCDFWELPVVLAIRHGCPEVLQALLSTGVNSSGFIDSYPTLAYVASGYCQAEALKVLVDFGVDVLAPSPLKHSSLHVLGALLSSHQSCPVHEIKDIVNVLLEKGLNLDMQDANGRTPLHWLAVHCKHHNNVLERLLTRGSELEVQDEEGLTPLWHAVLERRPSSVRWLLAAGANVNSTNRAGETVLHWLAKHLKRRDVLGMIKLDNDGSCAKPLALRSFRLLLLYGADPTLRASNGKTAAESIQFERCTVEDCTESDILTSHGWHDSEDDSMNCIKEELLELFREH
ncbi:MAG: hypothetical protein Q9165_000338 [Trypethelium subeluteriae]